MIIPIDEQPHLVNHSKPARVAAKRLPVDTIEERTSKSVKVSPLDEDSDIELDCSSPRSAVQRCPKRLPADELDEERFSKAPRIDAAAYADVLTDPEAFAALQQVAEEAYLEDRLDAAVADEADTIYSEEAQMQVLRSELAMSFSRLNKMMDMRDMLMGTVLPELYGSAMAAAFRQ
eukprot:TRINITY_DN13663_c0_g1_i1.p1 TRINITY_DN13663_c0_g1~~TRINITY_DN13663_c0_g1_i1.p1  ORF type:complete len:176 (+),score=33.82 TRINITY_DN13663_c0_g1_i1:154-681(+)